MEGDAQPGAGRRGAPTSGQQVRLALYRSRRLGIRTLATPPLEALDLAWVHAGGLSPWGWERAAQVALNASGGAPSASARVEAEALLDAVQRRVRAAPGARIAWGLSAVPGASALALGLASAATRRVVGHVLLALGVVGLLFQLAHRRGGGVEAGRGLPRPGVASLAGGRASYTLLTVVGAAGPSVAPAAPRRAQAPAPRSVATPQSGERASFAPAPLGDAPAVVDAAPSASPTTAASAMALEQSSASSSLDAGVDGTSAASGGAGVATAGGLAYTALLAEAPMPFVEIGTPDGALWVSQTEVTEAQWLTVMGLDLTVLLGTVDRPARHLTPCDALRFANRVSEEEGFRPVYDVPRDCERGGEPKLRRGGDGFRLMSADEWRSLRAPGAVGAPLEDSDSVWAGGASALGLFGIEGGIAELVWQPGSGEATVMGCAAEEPGTCQLSLAANEVDLEVGMRLVRVAPGPR